MRHLTLGYLTLNAPPAETITAAAEAGFRSVGIRITGRRIADPYTPVVGHPAMIGELKHRLDDTGLRLSNVTAYHLFPDVRYEHMQAVIDTTAELGAKILLAHSYVPMNPALIDFFSRYCEYADRSGIRIALEFMRYSQIKSLDDATRWLDAAKQPNAGYVLDPLHVDRCGHSAQAIADLDPGRIVFAQLCDAKRGRDNATEEELLVEARTGRLAPGDGELPLEDYLDALPRDIDLEYEVPIPEHQALPVNQRAAIAATRFHRYLAAYAASRGRNDPWPGESRLAR